MPRHARGTPDEEEPRTGIPPRPARRRPPLQQPTFAGAVLATFGEEPPRAGHRPRRDPAGHNVLYREAHLLLEELADVRIDGTRKELLTDFATVPLLIIDDPAHVLKCGPRSWRTHQTLQTETAAG